jgi:hypothetical protein
MGASLDIIKISFIARCVRRARVYPHVTPALRGAFGCTLSRLFDKGDGKPSLYQILFKNETEGVYSDKYVSGKPNPYVFEAPIQIRQTLSVGESLSFSLTLFGLACGYVPEILFTIEQMLIGNIMNNERAFKLDAAANYFTGEPLYADGAACGNIGSAARPWRWTDAVDPDKPASRIHIRFIEPASIKENGRPAGDISFLLLLRANLNRIKLLTSVYGGTFKGIDQDSLEECASSVKTAGSSLRDASFTAFSRTKMQKKIYHGMVGDIEYEGGLTQFLPYINIGAVLHVGRNTVLGMGQYVWRIKK